MKNIFSIFKNTNSSKDIKPSSEILNGRISYKFSNGLECWQEELNLAQDEQLLEIAMSFDIENVSLETSSIKSVIDMLLKENSLIRFLDIVLCRTVSPSQEQAAVELQNDMELFKSLKNSELYNIVNDFFSLNPTVTDWFKTIGKGLTSTQMTRST